MEKKSFLEENLRPLIVGLILIIVAIVFMLILSVVLGDIKLRQVKVVEISGNATIERDGALTYLNKNAVINSGDVITTDKDCKLKIKIDDDKYICVEPNSSLYIQYTESADRGEISVNLTKGAVLNNISKKLNKSALYQVKTPNTNVTVHGTIFRVAFDFQKSYKGYSDVLITDVQNFEGEVGINLYALSGNQIDKELLLIEQKSARMITCSEISQFSYLNQDFDIYNMNAQVLAELLKASNTRELPYSNAELSAAYLRSVNTTVAETEESYVDLFVDENSGMSETTTPETSLSSVTSPTTVIYGIDSLPDDVEEETSVPRNDQYQISENGDYAETKTVEYTLPTGAPWWEMTN